MHPFGATLAQECVSLFMYDVETEAHVPAYARWLERADMAPAYAQHKLALQALQSVQPTERWILNTATTCCTSRPCCGCPRRPHHLGPTGTRARWATSLASLANAGQRPLTRLG